MQIFYLEVLRLILWLLIIILKIWVVDVDPWKYIHLPLKREILPPINQLSFGPIYSCPWNMELLISCLKTLLPHPQLLILWLENLLTIICCRVSPLNLKYLIVNLTEHVRKTSIHLYTKHTYIEYEVAQILFQTKIDKYITTCDK